MPINLIAPTIADYLKLKKQYEELQRGLSEQAPKVEPEAPPATAERQQSSLLNFSAFTSDLSSIAEESEGIPPPRIHLFTSSPNTYNNQDNSLILISDISSAPSSPPSEALANTVGPMPGQRSVRLNSRQTQCIHDINSGQDQIPLRRSSRIASQSGGPPTERSERNEATEGSELNERNEEAEGTEGNPPNLVRSVLATIGERFTMNSNVGTRNARLRQHRSELLTLLNTATVRELQALPQIGPKTALALIMQR